MNRPTLEDNLKVIKDAGFEGIEIKDLQFYLFLLHWPSDGKTVSHNLPIISSYAFGL